MSSLKDQARTWLQTVAGRHLGSNIRRYKFITYTGEVRENALGGVTYLQPFQGTVVEISDVFTLVKVSAGSFAVLRTDTLSTQPEVGAKVACEFYQLRRFDGTMADGSEDKAEGHIHTFTLTGSKTFFPVRWPDRYLSINERYQDSYQAIQNPYLRDLITQLEGMPCSGGWRRAANILVDAGASDLVFVDPPEEQSASIAPGIKAKVANALFNGEVEINYDRAADTYRIILRPTQGAEPGVAQGDGGQQEERCYEDIHFDELASRLIELIDDGEWLKVKVAVLKAAPKQKQKQAQSA